MKHNKIYTDGKYVPQRMCVACRTIKPKKELIRIVLCDGGVAVDTKGNMPGRGCYLCNNKQCIEKAQKIHGAERGLKTNVPDSIYEECIKIGE